MCVYIYNMYFFLFRLMSRVTLLTDPVWFSQVCVLVGGLFKKLPTRAKTRSRVSICVVFKNARKWVRVCVCVIGVSCTVYSVNTCAKWVSVNVAYVSRWLLYRVMHIRHYGKSMIQ